MTGEVEQNLQLRCHDKKLALLIIRDVTRRRVRVRVRVRVCVRVRVRVRVRESVGNLYSYISASSCKVSE